MGTLTILLHPYFPRRSNNSSSHLNMDPRNAWFISIFHGWKMFQPNLKSKLLQPISVATLPLKNMLFLQPGFFFPQPERMYYLPITTIMLFINLCATAIVGMCDVHLKGCKNALNNMFPGRSETIILLKIALISPVPARKTALLKSLPMTLHLDRISRKTLPASQYSDTKFSILAQGHTSFHLSVLEATFIKSFQGISLQFKTHSLTLFYFHF